MIAQGLSRSPGGRDQVRGGGSRAGVRHQGGDGLPHHLHHPVHAGQGKTIGSLHL